MSYVITDPGQQNLGARGMSPGPSNGKMLEKVQPARKEDSREGGFRKPENKGFQEDGRHELRHLPPEMEPVGL